MLNTNCNSCISVFRGWMSFIRTGVVKLLTLKEPRARRRSVSCGMHSWSWKHWYPTTWRWDPSSHLWDLRARILWDHISVTAALCGSLLTKRGAKSSHSGKCFIPILFFLCSKLMGVRSGPGHWCLTADFCSSEQSTVCPSHLSKLISHTSEAGRLCNPFIALHKLLHSMGYAFGILEVSFFEADLCYKIIHIPAQLVVFACIIAAFFSPDFSSRTRAGLLMSIFIEGKNPK